VAQNITSLGALLGFKKQSASETMARLQVSKQ
jgi:hypothetical protein